MRPYSYPWIKTPDGYEQIITGKTMTDKEWERRKVNIKTINEILTFLCFVALMILLTVVE